MATIGLALLLLVMLFVLIGLRVPVAFAMLVVGGYGYAELSSINALMSFLKTSAFGRVANYSLVVIPLFILMGEFAVAGGLGRAIFRAANAWLGHVRGGLAIAAVMGCAGFGAICGSSIATVATMTRLAMPEMRRFGYSGSLATGSLAAGGTLGILIPPSIVLVIYGILTEQSISSLFLAAIGPGILATLLYMAAIAIQVRLDPGSGPAGPHSDRVERLRSLLGVWPVVIVFALVIGGMYGGWFTPGEAAAAGAVATGLHAVLAGGLRWPGLRLVLLNTARTSAMCFMILIAAEIYNGFLALSRLPVELASAVEALGLAPIGVVIAMLAVYLLLGCIMDSLSMILLTVPVFYPVVVGLDLGLTPTAVGVWFGILALMTVEIGLITPPFGLNVFIINGMTRGIGIVEAFRGVVPFFVSDLVRVALVTVLPWIALGLTGLG